MQPSPRADRHFHAADVIFAFFLIAYTCTSITLIPFDFTDLCYLFSLEQGTWTPQEWVHPIYVPTLHVFSSALGVFGVLGHMLVPVELLSVTASVAAFVLLYRLARRFAGAALAAAVTLAVTATCTGFWDATVRSTPYALAFLCQTISLSLLISDEPVRPRRYALAGVFGGLAMGLHASAMALAIVGVLCAVFEPDPNRSRQTTSQRILAFGGAMLTVAVVDWTVFLAYNHIGLTYFRNQDFGQTFLRIEQVPGTSIYTSGSALRQLSSLVASVRYQGGEIVWLLLLFAAPIVLWRLWNRTPPSPVERRLTIAAGANFAAIAGFFLINNTHNGFIFASLTLLPVLLAVGLRNSWIGLAALIIAATPGTRYNIERGIRAGVSGANDPQLAEVRFLEQALGPRDVLLTPGSPFPEIFYLSHLNVFETSLGGSTHQGNEVPVLNPGAPLRARVAWWLGHGTRVFYALGDDSTDFTGDVSGAEKEHQIFWRPETAARERAPALQKLRAALEASGLELRDGVISPRGQHYAEVQLPDSAAPIIAPAPADAPSIAPAELAAIVRRGDCGSDEPVLPRRAQFVAELASALPEDPWIACDVMDVVCQAAPRHDGKTIRCQPLAGCDERIGRNQAIALARLSDASGERSEHEERRSKHLSPAVGQVLQNAAQDALLPVVQRGFTVTRVDVHDDTIELAIEDQRATPYGITLALPEAAHAARPDGQGRNFRFYLSPSQGPPNPDATAALLASAALFDQAIPDAALQSAASERP